MRWTYLLLFLILVSSVYSLSVVNVQKNESYSTFVNIKEQDVKKLSSETTLSNITSVTYINIKDKDVASLSISSKKIVLNNSLSVYVYYNLEVGEKVVFLDIANTTYKNFLIDTMNDKKFADSKENSNVRIIINNESTSDFGFSLGRLHYLHYEFRRPFTALVVSRNNTVYIYGNSVVGIVNGLEIFLSNEDKFLNSDYVAYYDDNSLEGLKRWDLYKTNSSLLFSSLYTFNVSTLKTINGLKHRVKHFIPLLSSKYINGTIGNTDTIVIGSGLWSDLDTWSILSESLVNSGYDVYKIEITGGPDTECSTCYNYDFAYLTDYAWPNMIGFIDSKTSKNISYIGHSNGARTALSSLDNWGNTGRTFNESFMYNMSSRPIRHLIASGVPGAFDGDENLFANRLSKNGKNINSYSYEHISFTDALVLIYTNTSNKNNNTKISKNLFHNYYEFAKNTTDLQPGYNTSVNKFDLIYSGIGIPFTNIILIENDEIVSMADEVAIFNNINSSDKNKYLLMNKIHDKVSEDKEIVTFIKERLKNE
ncbi:MAG: hypothetical protein WC755_03145 [Candidatus Woesearchaeota archaeon]|jgi:hypothetical protein